MKIKLLTAAALTVICGLLASCGTPTDLPSDTTGSTEDTTVSASDTTAEPIEDEVPEGNNVVAKEFTLYEVKPRYGIDKKVAAEGVSQRASFINGMDGYIAEISYPASVTLAEEISVKSGDYKKVYITFSCAVGKNDTAINENASLISLELSADGKNYTDSGVKFTAELTDEKVIAAKGEKEEMNIYRFTSEAFAIPEGGLKNIRLVPAKGDAAKGVFRLHSLYVWGDTGEKIVIPTLSGNLNPEVVKTTENGVTEYLLYKTGFENLYSWTTNVLSPKKQNVSFPEGSRPYAYFGLSKNAVADGSAVKIFSPDMELDTSLYDSVKVEYTYFRNSSDPAFTMKVSYSTDGALTWRTMTVSPAVEKVENAVQTAGSETYRATIDLKKPAPNEVITNVVIMPYGNNALFTLSNGSKKYNSKYTAGAFRMLDFSITGVSSSDSIDAKAVPIYEDNYDSKVIQQLIDDAAKAGESEVMIPSYNPRNGSNLWEISKTIEVPSNMTLYINNCRLMLADYYIGNLIANENSRKANLKLKDEDTNIHIIGVADARLLGGKPNGFTSDVTEGSGISGGMMSNILLLMHNVNGFSIENLRCEEARFWAVAMLYSRNGEVRHMDFYASRVVPEQDGVDLRCGCNNIIIDDVTGITGDDSTALNAINPSSWKVLDKDDDIYNVKITNINTRLVDLRMQVRLTCTNGNKIHDVEIDGVFETYIDFGGKNSSSTIRLGDPKYTTGKEMARGDINNVTIRNVTGSSTSVINVFHPNVFQENWAYDPDTVVNKRAGMPVLKGYNITNPQTLD